MLENVHQIRAHIFAPNVKPSGSLGGRLTPVAPFPAHARHCTGIPQHSHLMAGSRPLLPDWHSDCVLLGCPTLMHCRPLPVAAGLCNGNSTS